MKLDMGSIWNEASQLVRANTQVLAALAGVFFLLPSFAFTLLMPAPQPQPGASPETIWPMIRDFYIAAAPWLLAMMLVSALGQLAAFALLARSGRVTVGQALREAMASLLPWLATQLIVGLAALLAAVVVTAIGKAGAVVVAVLLGLILTVGFIYVSLRLAMMLPVIAVDKVRNPLAVLQRSWDLTRGNVGAILLYMILLTLAFVVASIVIGIVTGILAAIAGGSRGVEVVSAAISALLGAGFTVFVIASLAAMHRRLSGGPDSEHAETFG